MSSMHARINGRVVILNHFPDLDVMAAFITGSFEFVTWTASNHHPAYTNRVDQMVIDAIARADATPETSPKGPLS